MCSPFEAVLVNVAEFIPSNYGSPLSNAQDMPKTKSNCQKGYVIQYQDVKLLREIVLEV